MQIKQIYLDRQEEKLETRNLEIAKPSQAEIQELQIVCRDVVDRSD